MSGPFAEGGPSAPPRVCTDPDCEGCPYDRQEFTPAQRAGRERMPCIGHRGLAYRSADPCEYPSTAELVVHEPGTGARLVAPVCFTHAAALMHGEPADLILDLYRYELDRLL